MAKYVLGILGSKTGQKFDRISGWEWSFPVYNAMLHLGIVEIVRLKMNYAQV